MNRETLKRRLQAVEVRIHEIGLDFRGSVSPPASEREIQTMESRLDWAAPQDLREFLKCSNGLELEVKPRGYSVGIAVNLMSCKAITDESLFVRGIFGTAPGIILFCDWQDANYLAFDSNRDDRIIVADGEFSNRWDELPILARDFSIVLETIFIRLENLLSPKYWLNESVPLDHLSW